jgi:hypothetical protein
VHAELADDYWIFCSRPLAESHGSDQPQRTRRRIQAEHGLAGSRGRTPPVKGVGEPCGENRMHGSTGGSWKKERLWQPITGGPRETEGPEPGSAYGPSRRQLPTQPWPPALRTSPTRPTRLFPRGAVSRGSGNTTHPADCTGSDPMAAGSCGRGARCTDLQRGWKPVALVLSWAIDATLRTSRGRTDRAEPVASQIL